jgi:DNA modification methylase
MKTTHTCIIGDARKMTLVADESVHVVVTSPPYWQLKDYGAEEQIGFNHAYEAYINHLNLVWQECFRVLHPGCRLVVNIGDQFARSVYYGRYKIIPIRTEIIKFCETIGFDYMGAIIWQKKTTMNTTGGATVMGSYPFPRNGVIEIDYEFILIFKKPGNTPKIDQTIKEQSRLSKEQWREYFSGHWYFSGVKQDRHLAMFPVELPKRVIEMFTFVGETVLDPFLGSGTTSLAAIRTARNSIGYEIHQEFLPIIKDKLGVNDQSLFDEWEWLIKEQKPGKVNWEEEINRLPYIFSDPVQFDKHVDPHTRKFGSKISTADDATSVKRETYLTIKAIISPNLIKLQNDLIIRLIGVKPLPQKADAAVTFLNTKILKRQIYLKYDEIRQDQHGYVLAYVYMKNKTFINAHLLKRGLVEVDTEYPFTYQQKFEQLLHAGSLRA